MRFITSSPLLGRIECTDGNDPPRRQAAGRSRTQEVLTSIKVTPRGFVQIQVSVCGCAFQLRHAEARQPAKACGKIFIRWIGSPLTRRLSAMTSKSA